eukprot:CAMPEP_0113895266 /NCGR_PEP_ID=MMETSP0780_2-20120614/17252_1 /TAXON_ID=652834 /ORGANISM="Palpitomonas bilix" /LENGTH=106 /DNA_ID=CAMNT_0000886047 /DNA_START=440 /DNA_END=760 /DNA_ORIENTATION=- /assembly_acc=CAM_ASM_000599
MFFMPSLESPRREEGREIGTATDLYTSNSIKGQFLEEHSLGMMSSLDDPDRKRSAFARGMLSIAASATNVAVVCSSLACAGRTTACTLFDSGSTLLIAAAVLSPEQ